MLFIDHNNATHLLADNRQQEIGGRKMVFFSKNKKTAITRIKKLAERETYYKDKVPTLAEKQIKHISGWKTWKLKKK